MSDTTLFRGDTGFRRLARDTVDSNRLLDALLRGLVRKKSLSESDLQPVLMTTIRKVLDAVKAQTITIFLVDPETRRIRFQHVYYSPALYEGDDAKRNSYDRQARELEKMSLAPGTGIAGTCIEKVKPVLIRDARKSHEFDPQIDKRTGFVTQSIVAVPLKIRGEALGCIEAINKCEDGQTVTAFDKEDAFLLREVAAYSAQIIYRTLHPDEPFSEHDKARWLARLIHSDFIEITPDTDFDMKLIDAVGKEHIRQFRVLPIERLGRQSIRAIVSNPFDVQTFDDFAVHSGFEVAEKRVGLVDQIKDTIERLCRGEGSLGHIAGKIQEEFQKSESEEDAAGQAVDEEMAPVVELANSIIREAYERGASDIHVESAEDHVRIRYRVEGTCVEVEALPKGVERSLISRFKVMSQLNISERRLPQDGRIAFKKYCSDVDLDLRVSTAPMQHGEKVCMRLLAKGQAALQLAKLGFSSYNLERYRRVIRSPFGMILHCGPTGSGKSMSLYAALNEINSPAVNIATAEDPIEYTLPGINQMQVHSEIGLSFAGALRCFLRQDPDIILVGEIRDRETAEIAVEAALTGHLLFSTLHTNDAPTSVSRLVEMGVDRYLIANALACVCSQRLLRCLCPKCRRTKRPTPDEMSFLECAQDENVVETVFLPVGCDYCTGKGFSGRTGIHELMSVTEPIRDLVSANTPANHLKKAAREQGMRTLFEDAMEKVKGGKTALAEALATVKPDDG